MRRPWKRTLIPLAWLAAAPLLAGGALPAAAAPGDAPAAAALAEPYASAPEAPAIEAALVSLEAAGADPAILRDLAARFVREGLPASDLLAVLRHGEDLSARSLPVTPVLSRYLQGLAKGVPLPRIHAAARDLETRLAEAASHLDAGLGAGAQAEPARLLAIDHAAYALGVGVPADALERSIALAAPEPDPLDQVQAPLLTLGVLVASGLAPDKSLEVVHSAWDHGYRGRDLERLGKALGQVARTGERNGQVADRVIAMIDQEVGQERVFRGLDELAGQDQGANRPPGVGPTEDPSHRQGPTKRPGESDSKNRSPQRQFSSDRS